MKKGFLFLMCFANVLNAGIPVWTFTPQTATSVVVSPSTSATVTYLVTNQSKITHSLVLEPITGVTQNTSGNHCKSPFVLRNLESCTLALNITGADLASDINDGPVVCQQGGIGLECYRPSYPNRLQVSFQNVDSVLTVSTSSLLLKASGNPRVVTITNGSTYSAYNVNYTISPSLPINTTITPANCGTIAPGGVCTLTISPGSTPSTVPTQPSGSSAVPSVITVSGSNTNTVQTNISVLTYANIVENGLIFYIDDSTLNTQSISGKVVGQAAAETQILWTSLINDIPGATSASDGISNTSAIVNSPDCSTNVNQCAAYYCRQIGAAWYLPAETELSGVYTQFCSVSGCTYGGFNFGSYYWSSTQSGSSIDARAVLFSNGSTADFQKNQVSSTPYTRCIRPFS